MRRAISCPRSRLLRRKRDVRRRETRFLELAASHGVLFKRGAYNFAAIAHDEETITEIESAASAAFVEMLEEEQGEA